MIGSLTPLGKQLVEEFNRLFVYARCSACGLMGCPVNDGVKYACPRAGCRGHMQQLDPETLRVRFVRED